MRTCNYCDEILLVLHLSIPLLVMIVSSIMVNCYSATDMLTTCRVGRGFDYSLMVSNKLLLIKNMLCATHVLNCCRVEHFVTQQWFKHYVTYHFVSCIQTCRKRCWEKLYNVNLRYYYCWKTMVYVLVASVQVNST